VLLDFTESLVVFVKDKKSGQVRIKLLNVKALGLPLEPVSSWWSKLHSTARDAFEYLWHGWLKGNSADGDSEGELRMDQDQPTVGLNVSGND
ncbi:hypothetical protein KI387_032351, partial [Taxus chinensis]